MSLWSKWLRRGRDEGHGVLWPDPAQLPPGAPAIYQICWSPKTRAEVDPAFLPLDNTANRRPDWREYHPMRSFLREAPLDEDRFYGFFSPKFTLKTTLGSGQVLEFLQANAQADVALFSPFLDLQALFLNSFVQGDYFHPGLLPLAEGFFGDLGIDLDLRTVVMDHRGMVFCNFLVAKPRFWRAWLAVTEALYERAERRDALGRMLCEPARYRENERVEFKIFIMERVADLLLATQPQWQVAAHPYSRFSDMPCFPQDVDLVLQCNALKAAFRDTGDVRHIESWQALLAERGIPPPYEELRAAHQTRMAAAGSGQAHAADA